MKKLLSLIVMLASVSAFATTYDCGNSITILEVTHPYFMNGKVKIRNNEGQILESFSIADGYHKNATESDGPYGEARPALTCFRNLEIKRTIWPTGNIGDGLTYCLSDTLLQKNSLSGVLYLSGQVSGKFFSGIENCEKVNR